MFNWLIDYFDSSVPEINFMNHNDYHNKMPNNI